MLTLRSSHCINTKTLKVGASVTTISFTRALSSYKRLNRVPSSPRMRRPLQITLISGAVLAASYFVIANNSVHSDTAGNKASFSTIHGIEETQKINNQQFFPTSSASTNSLNSGGASRKRKGGFALMHIEQQFEALTCIMGEISDREALEDVHPIELTVQSLLDGPLETLNLNIKSLQESQTILFNILQSLEDYFMQAANNIKPGTYTANENSNQSTVYVNAGNESGSSISDDGVQVNYSDADGELDLKTYLSRLISLRKRIKHIEKILDRVECKLVEIENTVGIHS
ncbi:hypothetical protein CANINC_003207 [Pichia inconspicua]|uniref:Uncharacterized protein n=1 Tax=Pichia inconspicua TaxID=52247 RepID=A0A4T0WZ91_9ASCO|nr:hypothetical protein CANINC_003207 [[Candida] inconspicua]